MSGSLSDRLKENRRLFEATKHNLGAVHSATAAAATAPQRSGREVSGGNRPAGAGDREFETRAPLCPESGVSGGGVRHVVRGDHDRRWQMAVGNHPRRRRLLIGLAAPRPRACQFVSVNTNMASRISSSVPTSSCSSSGSLFPAFVAPTYQGQGRMLPPSIENHLRRSMRKARRSCSVILSGVRSSTDRTWTTTVNDGGDAHLPRRMGGVGRTGSWAVDSSLKTTSPGRTWTATIRNL